MTNQWQTSDKPVTNQNKEYKEYKEYKENKEREKYNIPPYIPPGELCDNSENEIPDNESKQPKKEKEKSPAEKEKEESADLRVDLFGGEPIYHPDTEKRDTGLYDAGKEVRQSIAAAREEGAPEKQPSKLEEAFEAFRKAYPGRKRGHGTEFDAFKRKHKDWTEIVPLLMPALQRMIEYKKAAEAAGQWTASWANLSTWLYQARWEEELPEITTRQPKQQYVCDYEEEDAAFISKNR